MTTYKFTTKVSKDGTIKLPNEMFGDEEVEITITSNKTESESVESTKAVDFVNKWAGFMQGVQSDENKYNRLMEKHA